MKGRETKVLGGAPSADLLVCFPSRAHLSLMPKPICSPARPTDPTKRHHLKRITTRSAAATGTGSPLFWAKNKHMGRRSSPSPETEEPTSPKVTCAGQIKVRPRAAATCRNWQSVMEEVERIHNRSKHKKKSNWAGPLGFKKDVMNFLTCLRSIRLDFRCFGSFPEPDVTSDDENNDDDDDDDNFKDAGEGSDQSSTVFSKWFMVLQENQNNNKNNNISTTTTTTQMYPTDNDKNAPTVPPPNALLLMRCRSAPAKSWLEERGKKANDEEDKKEEDDDDTNEEKKDQETLKVEEEEEKKIKKKKRESLAIVMKYDTDFYNLSSEVAQETWIVGGFKDPFSRSRSWKR